MALKFKKKLTSGSKKQNQSIIQPNASLNIENLSKYTQTVLNKDTLGFKGLKHAFEKELEVEIVTAAENGNTSSVKGVISHYDEKYEQLLLVVGSNLKRIVFNQIVDVHIEEATD